jgi:hypothetical protein
MIRGHSGHLGADGIRPSNIKIHLQESECGHVDWIYLDRDRTQRSALVSMVMNPRVPLKAGNFLASLASIGFSKKLLHAVSY